LAAFAAAAAAADSDLLDSDVNDARCCDKIDRFSSIGVTAAVAGDLAGDVQAEEVAATFATRSGGHVAELAEVTA